MKVIETAEEVRASRWADPAPTWGLVPTMGALHEGHLSLVRRARAENECVGVSIFVNPTQFAPGEDLERYPRPLEQDLALLEAEGADLVWTPTPEHVYPPGFQTRVTVEEVAEPLEGAARPAASAKTGAASLMMASAAMSLSEVHAPTQTSPFSRPTPLRPTSCLSDITVSGLSANPRDQRGRRSVPPASTAASRSAASRSVSWSVGCA